MQKQRDHPKKHSMENIIMIILIISISITSFGLLGTLFKPSNNTEDDTSIKVDGSFNGSITVDHNTNKNPEKDNVTEGETDTEGNDENADTDTTPDDEPKEENIVDLSIYLHLDVPDGNTHCAYITVNGVSTFYKMSQTGSQDYRLQVPEINITDATVIFCRMRDDSLPYSEDKIASLSEEFDLINNKTYDVSFE